MRVEHEIKLRLSPEAAAKLRRLAALRPLRTGRPATRRLTSTYFDTPEFGLRNNEMALRVRQIGRRRIQTLKLPGDGAMGVQAFHEYEADVSGDRPEPKGLGDRTVRARLVRAGLAKGLQPVFVTEFDRHSVPVRIGTSEIELAVDQGEIRAAGRSTPICEAELELRSGRIADLFKLAIMLHERVPFSLEGRTKAARGYGLLAGDTPRAVKGRLRGPKQGESIGRGFVAAMRAGLGHLRANEAAVLAGVDPEGVHQMRVALRRLRGIVSAYASILVPAARSTLRDELKWLQGVLGPARDWDVLIAETLRPARESLPNEPGLAALLDVATSFRDRAYAGAHKAIQSPRYTALILQLELWLETDAWIADAARVIGNGMAGNGTDAGQESGGTPAAAPFAVAVLDSRLKKLVKLARRHKKLSDAELHDVRIAAKKLRYAGDLFADLFGRGRARAYLGRLAAMQDALGSLNDGVTAGLLLRSVRRRKNSPDFDRAAGIALGWGTARVRADTARFAGLWRSFARTKPFWR